MRKKKRKERRKWKRKRKKLKRTGLGWTEKVVHNYYTRLEKSKKFLIILYSHGQCTFLGGDRELTESFDLSSECVNEAVSLWC